MTKEEFDAAVKALRGKVAPKNHDKKKADCTPEEWAAKVDYTKAAQSKWRLANPERNRESKRKLRAANIDHFREVRRMRYAQNPEKEREQARLRASANRERHRENSKRWVAANPERRRRNVRRLQAEKRKSNPDFKLRQDLRCRLYQAIKGNAKQGSAVRDMGCTIAEFWAHMEPQFQSGMTRGNMGKAWEIDHIYPLSKADLTGSRTEFLAANNWRNLQPLTPKQNGDKGDTVTPEAQALFDQLKAEFAREIYAESA